jgi:hypothetical protein
VIRAARGFHFAQLGAESTDAANRSAAQEMDMAILSFARIMYGTNEDLHIRGAGNFASRPVNMGMRDSVGTSGGHSSGNPAVDKLLRFARLLLDGKGQ